MHATRIKSSLSISGPVVAQDYREYNLSCLKRVAEKIAPLREEVVFVGGTTLPFLLTRPVDLNLRKSKDVDLLTDCASKQDIYAFEDRLWDLGFKKRETGVICRWALEEIALDVLPADPDILGFNNRWCYEAMRDPLHVDLGKGLVIRIINAPCFLGIKFNAFYKRGNDDYVGSRDIYDMLVLFAGRPEIQSDILESASPALKSFLLFELSRLMKHTHELQDFLFPEQEAGNQLLSIIASRISKILKA